MPPQQTVVTPLTGKTRGAGGTSSSSEKAGALWSSANERQALPPFLQGHRLVGSAKPVGCVESSERTRFSVKCWCVPKTPHTLQRTRRWPCRFSHGSVQFEVVQNVGWDQWRFAAPAHHEFSTFPDGGPAFELSWSHPPEEHRVVGDEHSPQATHVPPRRVSPKAQRGHRPQPKSPSSLRVKTAAREFDADC